MSYEQSGAISGYGDNLPGCSYPNAKGGNSVCSELPCQPTAEGWLREPAPTLSPTFCGYALADRGVDLRTIQEWLGHRSIEMTVKDIQGYLQRRFIIFGGAD